MTRTNTPIIEDAISEIRPYRTAKNEYKLLLDGVLGRDLSEWELITIYVTNEVWKEHTDEIKLSDIAYIHAGVNAICKNNPLM